MSDNNLDLPKMAMYLGYGGLIPFVVLAIVIVLGYKLEGVLAVSVELWLAIYAAVIISFLGAVHWGFVIADRGVLSEREKNNLLIYSVLPSLLAWFSFLLTIKLTLMCLGVLILLCYLFDHLLLFKKIHSGTLTSFSKLRLHLTIIVSLSLFVAAF